MTRTAAEIEAELFGVPTTEARYARLRERAQQSMGGDQMPMLVGVGDVLTLLAMRDELRERDAVDEDAVQRWVAIIERDFPDGITPDDVAYNLHIATDVLRQMAEGVNTARVRFAAWERIAAARTPDGEGE